jgi:hypothetical protein
MSHELEEFNHLLQKKHKKFKDLRKIILTIRKNNYKMPDAVLEYGLLIINEHKSQAGDECTYIKKKKNKKEI